MPESSSAVEQPRNDRKTPGRHNWRAKLFASDKTKGDDKQKELGLATDVSDFLNGAGSNTSAKVSIGPPTPGFDVPTAQDWPSVARASRLGTETAVQGEGPFQHFTPTNAASPRKRAGDNGLRVRFTDLAPLIIGEGGDEAEMPPKDILKQRWRLELGRGEDRSDAENGEVTVEKSLHGQLSNPSASVDQNFFNDSHTVSFGTLIRNITSELRQEAKVPQEEIGFTLDEEDSSIVASSEGNEDAQGATTLSLHAPTPNAAATTTQSRVRLEQGRELHLNVEMSSPSLDNTAIKHAEDPLTSRPPLATRGYTPSDIESIANDSLCTLPSPQPPSQTQANSFHSHDPASLAPRKPSQPNGGLTTFRDPVQQCDPPIDNVPKATPLSLRTVAHAVGSDALDDFARRVQHYNSLFRSTAAAGRPNTDTTFVEWTRAATWWFLKGRGYLERVIRSRPRSADTRKNDQGPSSLPDISQAYVDLAKAWWILKEVTHEHPKLKPYGNASMKSMVAIIRGFKEEKLAGTVEMHVRLEAGMRALVMSMKRNNLWPPSPEVDSQLTGVDMRIWNAPPPLPAFLLPLLSSRPSPTHAHNENSDGADHLPNIPIGDTADHFHYGSMFVQILVTVQSDSGEGTSFPCVFSIVRQHFQWQIDAILASQDEQVRLVIQSDRSAGFSWSDVEWKVPKWQLQIRLTERIEVQVQFKEHDYNILCRLHAHNQKVMRSFEPRAQEALLFEATLRNFTCLDPRRSKRFPGDAIKRCRLRLYEKKVTRVQGTKSCKVHQGWRLMVITPPTVKALSSVESYLSCKKPVLFSYLRGEEDAPALLLKLSDEADYSENTSFSVVMTFDEAAQRAQMHSLLGGTAANSSERIIATLVLADLSIRSRSLVGDITSDSETLPKGLQWEKIQILDSGSGQTPHGHDRTRSLRLCVTSPVGTMTDRLNLS